MNDLALVELVTDDKIWLRLVPRIDYAKDQNKGLD